MAKEPATVERDGQLVEAKRHYKINKRGKRIDPTPIAPRDFWAGEFGEEYTKRNRVQWEARVPFWKHIIELTNAQSFFEVGCNAGWNLMALRKINEEASMTGCDLNLSALKEAQGAGLDVELCSGTEIMQMEGIAPGVCELSFTAGVLIHVPPEELAPTMRALADVSSAFVLAIEYAADETAEVEYRGHKGKLWKRPYGRLYEAMGLSLVETGKAEGWEDDVTYYLLEK